MAWRWIVAVVVLSRAGVLADDVALIRLGEDWRYFKGRGEPSAVAGAWRQVGFEDSGWLRGPSGFGYPGYGAASVLYDMPASYTSLFLRKRFLVSDPAAIPWLILRLDYEDGVVAYLNGTEVARRGLPGAAGTEVPYHALAAYHPAGVPEEIDLSAYSHLLVPGENVLALQVHDSGLAGYNLSILPELWANVTRGPYLQDVTAHGARLLWKTHLRADSRVDYGTTPALGNRVQDTNAVVTHALSLRGLEPDTLYYYRVASSAGGTVATSGISTFRTFRTAGAARFAVLGDTGTGAWTQFQVAHLLRQADVDFVLHAGDLAYPAFHATVADTRCLSIYGAHMRTTPYYFALGNHDLYYGSQHFTDVFDPPTNSVSLAEHFLAGTSPEHFYSFDHGDVHVAVLFVPFTYQYKLLPGSSQYAWLTNDLAASSKPWKVLVSHSPAFTSSYHREDDSDYNLVNDAEEVRGVLLPVASRYGVQLVVSAHDHVYERFVPTDGVQFITTGGGGAGLYGLDALDLASVFFSARHHCVRVAAEGATLHGDAIGTNGDVFDRFIIHQTASGPRPHAAVWHTPDLQARPGEDGPLDTRLKRPALLGTPIPTRSGRVSNLGQVRVNNDATHVYVGFEGLALREHQNVFLFVGSPRRPGVAALAGLGNGTIDPAGEGVDGLDCLENLRFSNFSPGVGAVVGDKWADATTRRYSRPGLGLDIGQGVFYLDASLSDVPGARLHQLTAASTALGVTTHSSAHFIEVGIPLAALGNPGPGERVAIGAVVGTERFNGAPEVQVRELDSAFLGAGFEVSDAASAVLEGIEVELAASDDVDQDGLGGAAEQRFGTDPRRADTDGDTLPDGWEVAQGLDPLDPAGFNGASGDADLDQAPNRAEFLAGTDPRDPLSVLRLLTPASNPLGPGFRLRWPAVIGRWYDVEVADVGSEGEFRRLERPGLPIQALQPILGIEDDLTPHAVGAGRIYRVRVLP
jgi:hypothetical protein